ncbi:MAG: hypothetical protein ACI4R5_03200 [Acetatifactor sp.]
MSRFEKKFGKYAIPNLTLVLIMCYVVGYIIQLINSSFFVYLTLDPYRILHGEVWRLFTWLVVPPDSFDLFTLIMLLFFYNIGTAMERTMGTYRYNVYIFMGLLFTILGSFLCMGWAYLVPSSVNNVPCFWAMRLGSTFYSTYYINLSVFLAFAATYPDVQVLLMFVIPIKVKWMGILDAVLMVYTMIQGTIFHRFLIAAALLNFGVFYLRSRNLSHMNPKQVKRRAEFKHQVKQGMRPTTHKCAICGRTEESNPELEFRFCSKCNGNYEYCQEHLFTHEHVK